MSDCSIQVEGTFGAGGNCDIEGSNDEVNFHALNDPFQNVLHILNSNKIPAILEHTYLIRPNITAGDGTTSLTVTLMMSTSGHE